MNDNIKRTRASSSSQRKVYVVVKDNVECVCSTVETAFAYVDRLGHGEVLEFKLFDDDPEWQVHLEREKTMVEDKEAKEEYNYPSAINDVDTEGLIPFMLYAGGNPANNLFEWPHYGAAKWLINCLNEPNSQWEYKWWREQQLRGLLKWAVGESLNIGSLQRTAWPSGLAKPHGSGRWFANDRGGHYQMVRGMAMLWLETSPKERETWKWVSVPPCHSLIQKVEEIEKERNTNVYYSDVDMSAWKVVHLPSIRIVTTAEARLDFDARPGEIFTEILRGAMCRDEEGVLYCVDREKGRQYYGDSKWNLLSQLDNFPTWGVMKEEKT